MKIVNVILTSQKGGAEQVFLDYCEILKNKLGHEVFAIVKDDAPYATFLDEMGVETAKIKNKFGFFDFFAASNIAKILEKFDADCVITHAGRSSLLVKKAIKKVKNKKILQVAVNHSNNVKRSIGADSIISVNKEIFYRTIDLKQPEDRSFVIYNALNLSSCKEPEAVIDFSKNKISLGVMARFDRTKGYLEMLEALKILNEKSQKEFFLKIAGSGYFEKEIKSKIKELNLEKNVEFLEWISDKKEFFDSIDIFMLPSTEETFGLVLLEAMKYKCPIISSDADGPRVILRDKKDALLTNIKPIESYSERVAKNVLKMVEDDDFAAEIVNNSYKRLDEKFSFDRLENDLSEIFGKV